LAAAGLGAAPRARGGARACGTTASMRALQCARMRDTCSVLLGRSATLLLPAYLPIQSLRGRAGAACRPLVRVGGPVTARRLKLHRAHRL